MRGAPSSLVVRMASELEICLAESGTVAFRVAFKVLRSREDAEDVSQEAVVRALERFDTIGGYRLTENGKVIDVSAELSGEEPFSGAEGLGQYMHDNPRYPACVARKLYSYSRGLDSSRVRTSHFQAAFQEFQESGYRLRALLSSMALSESFYAAPPPPPPSDSTEVAANNARSTP